MYCVLPLRERFMTQQHANTAIVTFFFSLCARSQKLLFPPCAICSQQANEQKDGGKNGTVQTEKETA